MKFLLLILSMVLLELNLTFAQTKNMKGDCTSQDAKEQYDDFVFIVTHEDCSDNSNEYTHIFPGYCNVTLQYMLENQKKLFNPFEFIEYDSSYYDLQYCSIDLIWSEINYQDSTDKFLLEISDQNNTELAFIYGSMYDAANSYGYNINLAYMASMDDNDQYASGYSQQELEYVEIYDDGNSYLYEIQDKDRNNELVGLKYYSEATQSVHEKFIQANN